MKRVYVCALDIYKERDVCEYGYHGGKLTQRVDWKESPQISLLDCDT